MKVAQLPATFFKEIDTSTSTSSSSSSNSEEDDEQCDFGDIDNSHGGHYTDRIDNTLDPYIFMAHIMDPYYLAYMGGTMYVCGYGCTFVLHVTYTLLSER